MVQLDVALTAEKQADCVTQINMFCAEAKETSTLSMYPLRNIVSSAMKAVQMTVRQRFDPQRKTSRHDRLINAMRVAARFFQAGVMAMPAGPDVRLAFDCVDRKGQAKQWMREDMPGFLPEKQEAQFAEDLPTAWSTRDAPNAAASSAVTLPHLASEAAAMAIADDEEIYLLRALRPLSVDLWSNIARVAKLAPLTAKNGRTVLAKGKKKTIEKAKKVAVAGTSVFVSLLSAAVEAEGDTQSAC